MAAPVVIFPRDVGTPWTEMDGKRHRLVVPAAAARRLAELPKPDMEEDLDQWDLVYLDGSTTDALDLVTRKRWRLRRGQCGMGACCCDAVGWPVDYRGPIPDPEPWYGWPFWLDDADWDALAVECGRDVSELPWDELLAAVAEVRGAGEE